MRSLNITSFHVTSGPIINGASTYLPETNCTCVKWGETDSSWLAVAALVAAKDTSHQLVCLVHHFGNTCHHSTWWQSYWYSKLFIVIANCNNSTIPSANSNIVYADTPTQASQAHPTVLYIPLGKQVYRMPYGTPSLNNPVLYFHTVCLTSCHDIMFWSLKCNDIMFTHSNFCKLVHTQAGLECALMCLNEKLEFDCIHRVKAKWFCKCQCFT